MGTSWSGSVEGSDGRPLAGVAVSDGAAVAVTAADGRWVLPDVSGSFVWVSRPTGWDTDTWFRRTAELAVGEPVRFVLRAEAQPVPFSFAHLTDLHMSCRPDPVAVPVPDSLYGVDAEGRPVDRPLTRPGDLHDAIVDIVGESPVGAVPRFAVATGDLTDHGVAEEFALLAEALAAAPLPVHVLPGNHDHYGHEHAPEPGDDPVDSDGMGAGTTHRYERHVGPRWWSLTHGGLRLVALDWFSHRLGLDADRQERWLVADLATAAPGTPVLLLTHDQMARDLFALIAADAPHVRVVGSLTGHWHTSRVVRVDGQLHVNTGNATFGSFDWAPAHGRILTWDGQELGVRTAAVRGRAHLRGATFAAGARRTVPGATWATSLPGVAHLGAPALVGGGSGPVVVVPWSDDDRAAGGVVAHDAGTGERTWSAALGTPVRAGVTPTPDGREVVAVTISGEVAVLDARTGAARWRRQVGDPLRMWVHAAPVVADGMVLVGEVRTFAALDLATGAPRWARHDLARPENYTTPTTGVAVDGVLVAGFPFAEDHTIGLDLDTGATRWVARDIRFRSPSTAFVVDPADGGVVVGRLGTRVDKLDPATGAVRWKARLGAAFISGRPVVHDGAVYVTTGVGTVHRLDADTGAERWRSALPGEALLAMGPYRRTGQAAPAGPTLGRAGLYQPTADGKVRRLDPRDGAVTDVADLGAPLTVPVVVVDDGGPAVVVATSDGVLARVDG